MKSLVPLTAGLCSALALLARAADVPASPGEAAGPAPDDAAAREAPAAAEPAVPALKPGPMMSLDAAFLEVRSAYEQIGLRLTEKERELRKAVAAQQAAKLRAEQLETQLAEAQTDRVKLKKDVDRLRKQVDEAQEAIAGLLNTLTTLEEQLATAQQDNRRLTQEKSMLEATAKGAMERMKRLEEERDRSRGLLADVQEKLRGLLGGTESPRPESPGAGDDARVPPGPLPSDATPRMAALPEDRAAPKEIVLEPGAAKNPVPPLPETPSAGSPPVAMATAEPKPAPAAAAGWEVPDPVLGRQPGSAAAAVRRDPLKPPPPDEAVVAGLKPPEAEAPKPAAPAGSEASAPGTNAPVAVAEAPKPADAPTPAIPTPAETVPAAAVAAPESSSRTGLLERASAELEAGRFKEARALYEEAGRLDPDDRIAMLGLAETMLAAGDTAPAEKIAIQLMSFDRKNAGYLFLAGRIASATGRYQEATVHLENAMHEAPEDPAIRRELATVYYGLNRLGDAADMFRSVLDFDPKDAESHFNLAAVLLMSDPPWPAEAARHYQEALRLGEPRDEHIEKLLPR